MARRSDMKPRTFVNTMNWRWFLPLLVCLLLPMFASADVLPCDGEPVGLLQEGDTLHLLYRDHCCVVTAEHTLVPCPLHCETAGVMLRTMVTPQGHSYAVDGHGQLYRWTPEKSAACWEPVAMLDLSERSRMWDTVCVAGDGVVYEAAKDEDGAWLLTSYSMDTGAATELFRESDQNTKLLVQPDGSPALATGFFQGTYSIKRIESGGRSTPLASPDRGVYSGIISDGHDGWIVLDDNALYAISNEGESTLLNYVPHFFNDTQVALVRCFDDEIAFITENDRVFSLNIVSLTQQEQNVLKIGGLSSWTSSNRAARTFEASHPGMIVIPLEYPTTFAEVAQVITTGEAVCDVYILYTGDDGIRNMLRKGYYTDLSVNAEISEFVAGLYPIWQREVTVNGKAAALPLEVDGEFRMGVNTALWEELSLGDVPATWDELLDCIQRLYDDGVLEEYPLFAGSRRSAKRLLYLLLEGNSALYELNGQPVQYHNAKLLPRLERLAQLTPLLDDHDAHKPAGDALFQDGLFVGLPWRGSQTTFAPLPLGFDTPDDHGQLAMLVAAVIDPRCTQQELAQAYLVTLLETMEPRQRVALTDAECPGIETSTHAANMALLQANLAEYEADLAAARAAKNEIGIRESQEWIEFFEQCIVEEETENHWEVSPEAAAAYRAEIASYAMYRANGVQLIYNNAGAAFDSLLGGKMSAEDFVRQLDQIVNMWTMENR